MPTTSTQPAVDVRSLGKRYPLYEKRSDRVFDALGINKLAWWRSSSRRDFWALRGISLRVEPGDRVGIVGSNGAGKSTLLKLIAGSVEPTEGTAKVNGEIQALMELGTGFHPEFTGRENIQATLRLRGIGGKQLARMEAEIIDFAELESFIDQPLRTYSAGMGARLAFSAATSVQPDILIVDEVLGAGDAYFAGKCADRMRRLASSGASLLFVSHDVSAVEQMCDRAVWLDRGRIVLEGSALEISKAYGDFQRQRELRRLEARNRLLRLGTSSRIRTSDGAIAQLILRLTAAEPASIDLSHAEFALGASPEKAKPAGEVHLGLAQDTAADAPAFVLVDPKPGSPSAAWSDPVDPQDSTNTLAHRRADLTPGQGAAVVLNLEGFAPGDHLAVTLKARTSQASKQAKPEFRIEAFDGEIYRVIDTWKPTTDWSKHTTHIPEPVVRGLLAANQLLAKDDPEESESETEATDTSAAAGAPEDTAADHEEAPSATKNAGYEIFTGAALLESVRFLDKDGSERALFESFEPMHLEIGYRALLDLESPDFVACFHRAGIIALQTISGVDSEKPIGLIPAGTRGTVTLTLPELPLGRGLYNVSIAIFPPINMNDGDSESKAYLLQDRRYDVRVEQPEPGRVDMGIARGKADWSHTPLGSVSLAPSPDQPTPKAAQHAGDPAQ